MKEEQIIVSLFRVGRNLNRAYRTAEAFGVERLHLIECDTTLSGSLFQAKERILIETREALPPSAGLLALECKSRAYAMPLRDVNWKGVTCILLGGETSGLPAAVPAEQKAHIPLVGQISGLTVEAALAIALYEWRKTLH